MLRRPRGVCVVCSLDLQGWGLGMIVSGLQRYLAYKKPLPLRTLQQGYVQGHMVVLGRGSVRASLDLHGWGLGMRVSG